MPKLSPLLQIVSLKIYNFNLEKRNSRIGGMKTVTIERWNIHTLYHSIKGIIPKVINNI